MARLRFTRKYGFVNRVTVDVPTHQHKQLEAESRTSGRPVGEILYQAWLASLASQASPNPTTETSSEPI